jgi:hypothetical protein
MLFSHDPNTNASRQTTGIQKCFKFLLTIK